MEEAQEEKRCAQCQRVLEAIKAVAFFSMLVGEGYRCGACKMLYYRDLKPMARII